MTRPPNLKGYPEIVVADNKKVVARSGCIGPRLTGLNEQTLRLFAADCAAHVKHHAHDKRVSAAIIIARARAFELVNPNVWAAVWAAEAAARAAWWAAAETAAGWAAAETTASAAAWAAGCAGADARAAEKTWQSRRLLAYACGGIDLDACKAQTVAALPEAMKALGL